MKRLTAVAGAFLVAAAPPAEPEARIAAIEVRLLRAETGEFTANVLNESGKFFGWNTFMNHENAGYGAGDALVIVKVALSDPDANTMEVRTPLTITARSRDRQLAQRRFTATSIRAGQTTARILYLENVGCAGLVEVIAKLGSEERRADLSFECGE